MRNEDILHSQRMAGHVKRYHCWPVLRQQTVAEHCWQAYRVHCQLFGLPSPELAYALLHHDSGELNTGDIPFGVKQRVPGMKRMLDIAEDEARITIGVVPVVLAPLERHRLKICDLLEMWEFAMEELAMGNRFAEPILENTVSALQDITAGDGPTMDKIGQHMKWYDGWK